MANGSAAFEGSVAALAARATPSWTTGRHASELEMGYMAIIEEAA